MKKVFVVLLCVCLICANMTFMSGHAMEVNNLHIENIEVNEYTNRTEIHKPSGLVKSSNQIQKVVQENLLNEELVEISSDIITQKQIFYKPSGYEITVVENGVEKQITAQDSWSDDEGYLTIYTTAYKIGYDKEGDAIYTIEGKVQMHKTFKMRNQEEFVLHHSANGSYKPNSASGQQGYHESYKGYNPYVGGDTSYEKDIVNNLTPKFSSLSGINFSFKFPEDYNHSSTGGGVSLTSIAHFTNWWCFGKYDVIVSDKTNVQTCYYHNEKFFGGNLSVSFSAYGLGLSVTVSGTCTKYEAEPILLYNE